MQHGNPPKQTTDIAMVDGVPQRKASGGFYTQAEADEIMALPDPREPEQPTDRWDIDQILDRLYDRNSTPAWLLVALEDVRQEIERLRNTDAKPSEPPP